MADIISIVHNMMISEDHDWLNERISEGGEFANRVVQDLNYRCIIKLRDGNINYQLWCFDDGLISEANFRPRIDDFIF